LSEIIPLLISYHVPDGTPAGVASAAMTAAAATHCIVPLSDIAAFPAEHFFPI